MIHTETILNVADNSGARRVLCIRVLGGSCKTIGSIGDTIVVAIKECLPGKKIKKGDVRRAVIVRTRKALHRKDGSSISFDHNAVVLLNEKGDLIGTRVFGPVTKELRRKNFTRIVSLATHVL